MPTRDPHDRLVHILLCEELGGQRPPDLAGRILARAYPRWGLRRMMAPAAAAAAGVAAALIIWAMLRGGYPEPAASGAFTVAGGGAVTRGATLITADQPATLELGGYCRVQLAPASTVKVAGAKRAEEILLEHGSVICEVDRAVGTFGVRTELGTVSVSGTKFVVRIVEQKGVSEMSGRQLLVKVMVGAVLVTGAWGTMPLSAGEEGGVVTGILVEKGKAAIAVKAEGESKAVEYRFGDALAETVKKLAGGTLVKVTWKLDGERRALVAVEAVVSEAKEGEVTGKIVAKGKEWIDVKPQATGAAPAGPTERYMPRWTGGNPADGGGFDKEMLAKIAERRVGDVVKVKWIAEERKRVVGLEVVEPAKP